jgi:3-hydroxymyristoyl/3-hydroxydecanoyl-(acyl carrier protein) dehydratase
MQYCNQLGFAEKSNHFPKQMGSSGVATFEWTKKLSPFALTLQNENTKAKLQYRI